MKLFISFLFLISPIFTLSVFACECDSLPTVWSAFDESSAVFIGKVIKSSVKENLSREEYEKAREEDMIYEFEIVNSFKGIKNKALKINLGKPDICQSSFEVGETYLIYAYGNDEQNLRTYTFCSRIEKLINAQDQIYFINEKLKGKPEPQFYGSVVLSTKEQEIWKRSFLPNYNFFLDNGNEKVQVKTDKNGFFKINNLKKGIYDLSFEENSKYKAEFLFSTRFRVFENSMAIGFDNYSAYWAESISDKDFENGLKNSPEKFGGDFSKGVYFEIELKEKSPKQ